jgi:hypothetical protein
MTDNQLTPLQTENNQSSTFNSEDMLNLEQSSPIHTRFTQQTQNNNSAQSTRGTNSTQSNSNGNDESTHIQPRNLNNNYPINGNQSQLDNNNTDGNLNTKVSGNNT